ncbi:hypothetical protein VNO80_11032 [Phaseolus coccineus]|uniref:Uncharacterized protein n=1 Tax=Phaseolus coccineus TaxID=3886 RepID=A0AAN9NEI4_PHACN
MTVVEACVYVTDSTMRRMVVGLDHLHLRYPHLGPFQLPSNAVLVVYPGNAMRPVSQDEMMRQVRCLLAFLWFIYMMQHTQSSNLIEIEN